MKTYHLIFAILIASYCNAKDIESVVEEVEDSADIESFTDKVEESTNTVADEVKDTANIESVADEVQDSVVFWVLEKEGFKK
jgi:uncharacterized protein YfcZ (UPF0381/DUF406 family)